MTSTQAVGTVKRIFDAAEGRPCRHARSAGHRHPADRAGRGDQDRALRHGRAGSPIASPLRWGEARATDDAEGAVMPDLRPAADATRRSAPCLPQFTGDDRRRCRRPSPPSRWRASGPMTWPGPARRWSWSRARSPIHRIPPARRGPIPDHAELRGRFAARAPICARWAGTWHSDSALAAISPPCGGLAVGPFTEAEAISLESLKALGHSPAAFEHLLPVETALDDIPALALTDTEANRLRSGQPVGLLHRQDRDRISQLAPSGTWSAPWPAAGSWRLTRFEAGDLRPGAGSEPLDVWKETPMSITAERKQELIKE